MNGKPGDRIDTLHELGEVAKERRSVIVPSMYTPKPQPAAFVINMSGTTILRWLHTGLFVYEKGGD